MLPNSPQTMRCSVAQRHQPMSNLLGSDAATRLKAPDWFRSNVISVVSSPDPERKATYRPSAEMDTPCICGRRAKLSRFCGAAETAVQVAQENTDAKNPFQNLDIDWSPFFEPCRKYRKTGRLVPPGLTTPAASPYRQHLSV